MTAYIGVSHALEMVYPKRLPSVDGTPALAPTMKVSQIFLLWVFITGIFLIFFFQMGGLKWSLYAIGFKLRERLKKRVLDILYETK